MRKYSNILTSLSVLLFVSLAKSVTSTTAPPCRDDPFFQFGKYTVNGKTITRTCQWLAERTNRQKKWCKKKVTSYLPRVGKKCPEACDECGEGPINKDCTMDYPPGWHDSTDRKATCAWYAGGQNCQLWGNAYPYDGRTANQACCVCGGGCEDKPKAWRDRNGNDCVWYAANVNRCKTHGHRFRNNGFVAKEACCICEGGSVPGNNQDVAVEEE